MGGVLCLQPSSQRHLMQTEVTYATSSLEPLYKLTALYS